MDCAEFGVDAADTALLTTGAPGTIYADSTQGAIQSTRVSADLDVFYASQAAEASGLAPLDVTAASGIIN